MPLQTTIQQMMKKREAEYPARLHPLIMRRVRLYGAVPAAALWFAVCASSLFAVFSGWQLAREFQEMQAIEFLTIAADTMFSDVSALPLLSETALTFIPAQWLLVFAVDIAFLCAGLIMIRRVRQSG